MTIDYEELLETLGKRPRTMLELLMKKGEVSTYELGELGYDQAPRVAQDLKERGVRLRVKNGRHPITGSRMAIYSLADDGEETPGSFTGRVAIPKAFREEILVHFKSRCNVCNTEYNGRSLQVDHRVPFLVGGESNEFDVRNFQALCNSHQRAKSWECEHCENRERRDVTICSTCYWAIPDGPFTHVAMREERRLDLTFVASEIKEYKNLEKAAKGLGRPISDVAKAAIKKGASEK